MGKMDLYQSIAERTGGDIYIGVVGPVRTGKSTFIKRFMDLMVLPNVEDVYLRQRMQDELPQSGSGKTITTTEPKFVPAEAADLQINGNTRLRVRLVDCVGFLVNGASGHLEDGEARMVSTPWQEERIPFAKAAEMGTRKVITDHSTIGLVVTTDGTIGDIPREAYVPAEEQAVSELSALEKPFAVLVNSKAPEELRARELATSLRKKYGVPVLAVNCAKLSQEALEQILTEILYEFPVRQIGIRLPGYLESLPKEHRIKTGLAERLLSWAGEVRTLRDAAGTSAEVLADGTDFRKVIAEEILPGKGTAALELEPAEGLFYRLIEETLDCGKLDDRKFFAMMGDYAKAKKAYDKIEGALSMVDAAGYGIVQPCLAEMVLEEPEIFQQGNKFGVRLKAKAPSLHIIRTDITTEVAPVVGSESQSQDLIRSLLQEFEEDPAKIWETNIFGKSLSEMVTEQIGTKLTSVPDPMREKLRRTLQKVSDEGREHLICFAI
ncbi:MAG: stage IV sporulation protein A [Firmicutes bacterium]|nr:stage IV sporulation protein A [Bacillota bacterium]